MRSDAAKGVQHVEFEENKMGLYWVMIALLLVAARQCFADDLRVLTTRAGEVESSEMMNRYLLGLADMALARREAAYEALKEPEKLEAHSQRMRAFFLDQLGGLPERTPLNARVVGKIDGDGYRIEKIIFESRPGFHVTSTLYLPMGEPPFPTVLVPCGHDKVGKASQAYQRACILLATNGIAAFCYDPVGQGERYQLLDAEGAPRFQSTTEHTLLGVGSILLGTNTASYRVWDGMRAIDYLVSRDDIDPERIGCTGISGGGTLTSYLMALDPRIACAAPGCYLTSLSRLVETIGPQDAEQNIHGQIAFGMDHADYVMMAAPRPVLILAATHDFFDIEGTWQCFRQAKRFYTRLGHPERVELVEADETHGYSKPLREAMARWMCRWLVGRDEAIVEPDIETRTEQQLRCTPDGQVVLTAGERSAFELNSERNKRLAADRRRLWASAGKSQPLQKVRELAGVARLEDLPQPQVETVGSSERDGYRIDRLVIRPEDGIWLPALAFVPPQHNGQAVLYLHGEGKHVDAGADGPIARLADEGRLVLAVDLRGVGETESKTEGGEWAKYFGPDAKEILTAYLLGVSYVGMRAQDVLVCARFLTTYRSGDEPNRVHLVAVGESGPPALHAAALEPQLFASVRLERSLESWSDVVKTPVTYNQLVNTIHGALQFYDLPDLLGALPADAVTVVDALDPVRITETRPVDPR